MKLLTCTAGLLLLLALNGNVVSEPLWDGVASVPAVAHSPKTWLTCPKGESFKDKKSETGHKCVKRGLISDADGGAPKEVLAQDLLNTHFQPIAGFRAVAVGILPELVIGANTNYYSTTTVLVAYRLDAKN